MIRIVDLTAGATRHIEAAAQLLVLNFPQAWPDMAAAQVEVQEAFEPDRICRVALDDDDMLLGWIGGISAYSGNAWEPHPLVVREDRRGQGIGRALAADLEQIVRERGAYTLFLGTDDEHNQTSLSGVDLYPNVYTHIAGISNIRRHPYEFYQKLGFVIVGVMPDANGPGKPDIYMAKRIR